MLREGSETPPKSRMKGVFWGEGEMN